jgi:hypothetical protein
VFRYLGTSGAAKQGRRRRTKGGRQQDARAAVPDPELDVFKESLLNDSGGALYGTNVFSQNSLY